jgi:hypothetical protein
VCLAEWIGLCVLAPGRSLCHCPFVAVETCGCKNQAAVVVLLGALMQMWETFSVRQSGVTASVGCQCTRVFVCDVRSYAQ